MSDAESILKRSSELINASLGKLRHRYEGAPARLIESIDYSLLAGGKRLRPTLVLESARACGENSPSDATIKSACAIELIHTFSLVHDDLPAMDDDDLRRGKPTNHKQFDEATAILAGDAMVAMAFELLSEVEDPAIGVALAKELARATGPAGMIGGQMMDMAGESQSLELDQLQAIHRMKTGALLTSALRLGAIAGQASPSDLQSLTRFGRHLGLAFQIVDDILDETSTPAQMGKATKKDAARGKNTYPALLGLEASREEARKQVESAIASLKTFDASADGLRAIARFVVERSS